MPSHSYYCEDCDKEFSLVIRAAETDRRGYVNLEKGYEVSYLLSSLTPEQVKALPDIENPDDYDEWEVVHYDDIPEHPKCCECFRSNTSKMIPSFSGHVKGLGVVAFRREKELYEKGLNKQQAETFYKESMEASKERIATMGEVYKKVDFNMPLLAQKGLAKKTANVTKKLDNLKKANVELSKPLKKKK